MPNKKTLWPRNLVLWFWVGLGVSIATTGCSWQKATTASPTPKSFPSGYPLLNEDQKTIGFATALSGDFYVSVNHLWEDGDLQLSRYQSDDPSPVILGKYFNYDLVFFRDTDRFLPFPSWSSHPPALNQSLWWRDFEAQTLQQGRVVGFAPKLQRQELKDSAFFTINKAIRPGQSGTAIFDEAGRVRGLIVGVNFAKQESYVLRSDIVLQRWQELQETF